MARRRPHRRLAASIVAGALATAGVVSAQPSSPPTTEAPSATPAQRVPAAAAPGPAAAAAPAAPTPAPDPNFQPIVPPSTGQPLPPPEPGSVMRRVEHLSHKPSGFWTSNRPAQGGAYRWRMLGVGVLVLAISIFFLVRLLRRVSRERALGEHPAR